jgi:hypothetical protein
VYVRTRHCSPPCSNFFFFSYSIYFLVQPFSFLLRLTCVCDVVDTMDCRPLLSGSSRESTRRAPPPPLLPPSRVDASLVVFEDDVEETQRGDSAGPSSEARTSLFSSLSFSVWNDNMTAASRGGFAAALLRLFQQMELWCCAGQGSRCCYCCLRRSRSTVSGVFDNENDDFDNGASDVMVADALRASGVSHVSHHGKGGGTPATALVLDDKGEGSGTGSASRPHRQYAPPRSHSLKAGRGACASSPTKRGGSQQDVADDGGRAESGAEGSFAGSSTPPSSTAFGRVATAPGEHLVMQRGVLVRIAEDGTYTRVDDPAAFYGGAQGGNNNDQPRHSPHTPALEGGRTRSLAAPQGLVLQMEDTTVAAPVNDYNADTHILWKGNAAAEREDTAQSPYAVATAMHALEASRQSLSSLEQLSSVLSRLAPYLPLRVEAELDLNSSCALPCGNTTLQGADAPSPTAPAASAILLCVHVLGPLQPCRTAAALRLLEDVLLEDCDCTRMCINALHCADLDLRGVALGADEAPRLAGPTGSSLSTGDEEGRGRGGGGRLRAPSNAYLDYLVSPTTEEGQGSVGLPSRNNLKGGGSAGSTLSAAATATHVLAFLKNFAKGRGPQLTTLHFTRCFAAPHDMGRFVPLPLHTIRRLGYEHCYLTPAHIDALLMLARQQDAERRSSGQTSAGRRVEVSFGVLEELQLSGPLTSECIAELLDFIEEQQLAVVEGSNAHAALRQLLLPSALVRAAKEHPFVQASYQRVRVVSAH